MKLIKLMFTQTLMISTGILLLFGINMAIEHFHGLDLSVEWYYPLTIVLAGFLSSLPTLLLRRTDDWSRRKSIARVILHCICVYAIIMIMGYFFRWYSNWIGYMVVSIMFLIIYVLVWVGTSWIAKQDVKKINSALEQIRDEE